MNMLVVIYGFSELSRFYNPGSTHNRQTASILSSEILCKPWLTDLHIISESVKTWSLGFIFVSFTMCMSFLPARFIKHCVLQDRETSLSAGMLSHCKKYPKIKKEKPTSSEPYINADFCPEVRELPPKPYP